MDIPSYLAEKYDHLYNQTDGLDSIAGKLVKLDMSYALDTQNDIEIILRVWASCDKEKKGTTMFAKSFYIHVSGVKGLDSYYFHLIHFGLVVEFINDLSKKLKQNYVN